MTSYRIKFSKDSLKFLKDNKKIGLKFYQAFFEISENILKVKEYDIKNIKGYETLKRLRIGKYRALFEIIDNELVILVIDIDSRGDIYKRL